MSSSSDFTSSDYSSEYDARPAPPEAADRSFGELIGNLSNDFSTLVRQEIALAKVETKEEATKFGKAAGMLAGAGVAALLMLIFLSMTLMWLLDNWMHTAWAALIVTVLWAVAAGLLAQLGRKKLKEAAPPLQETKDTLKEDAQWAKTLKN